MGTLQTNVKADTLNTTDSRAMILRLFVGIRYVVWKVRITVKTN